MIYDLTFQAQGIIFLRQGTGLPSSFQQHSSSARLPDFFQDKKHLDQIKTFTLS
jgi:hypothetical protein